MLNSNQIFTKTLSTKPFLHTHCLSMYISAYLCMCVSMCVRIQNKNNCKFNFIITFSCRKLCTMWVCLSAQTQTTPQIPPPKPPTVVNVCVWMGVLCVWFRCIFKQMRLMFIFHFNQTRGYWRPSKLLIRISCSTFHTYRNTHILTHVLTHAFTPTLIFMGICFSLSKTNSYNLQPP